MTPAEAIAAAHAKLLSAVDELVGVELSAEWSSAANTLYKEQFAKKVNPYGEPWEHKAGDEKRTVSYYKFGAVRDVGADGFSLVVASGRPNRSCVPFEPRGLGEWKPKFDEILRNRMNLVFRAVRP